MELKKLIVEAVRHRDMIDAVLRSLDPNDVEQGLLVVQETLVSQDLKPFILSLAQGMIGDYNIQFQQGQILIGATLDLKQLGPLEVNYAMTVSELRFDASGHKMYGTFQETATSLGNTIQKLGLKAALLNGPLLKTAIQWGNAPFAFVDGNHLLLDFDRMDFSSKLPETLTLKYLDAKDHKLTLSFQ